MPKIPLLADHHKLVKFAYPDKLYNEDVESEIQKLVHKALDASEQEKRVVAFREAGTATSPLLISRDARRLSEQALQTSVTLKAPAGLLKSGASQSKQSDNPAGDPIPDSARPELDGPSRHAANVWVEETVEILKYNQDERRINDVDDGSVETCAWILNKAEFQKWNEPLSDSVMFIQGGTGLGKSVLAKFLVQSLKCVEKGEGGSSPVLTAEQIRKPIVAHFFPRGTEFNDADNSPKAILLSILYQIWEADSISCIKATRNLYNRFNQSRSLDFWWALFNDVRSNVTRDLYCIVDGLDECIKKFKSPGQSTVDDRMEGFLRKLCNIAHGPSTQPKTSCTKILIATRPTVEVSNATIGREIVLEIQEFDTLSAVGNFVDGGVRRLGQLKNLSSPSQDFIKEQIIQKSGHVFQTAQTALRRLRNERYNLENRDVVVRALDRVNSQKSDDAYEEVLEILTSAPVQDQVKAARIVRILFFLQEKLSLMELEHALLVETQASELILRPAPLQCTVDIFIRDYLALLVKIDHESMVRLDHQTVREYFQNFSGDRWQVYSCADRNGGHLHLALTCIRYMVLWRCQAITRLDINSREENDIFSELEKAQFFSYASKYWDLHTREAGKLIIPYIPLVNKLLGFDSPQAYTDYYLPMLYSRWIGGLDTMYTDRDFFALLPGSFLAANNLLHVLREYTRQRKDQNRSLAQRLMFWKSQAVDNDTIEADFDLNLQDENALGLTPLHCACQNGHLDTARLLLDCGASGEVYDKYRNSPFSIAVKNKREEIAELLIERDQCWDQGGRSLTLHLACYSGMSKVVRHLLEIGRDVNAQIFDGWTPLHLAAEAGHIDTLKVLLEAGGSLDIVTKSGSSPLYLAAKKGFLAVIEILFRYRPNLNPAPLTSDGRSPHHAAAAGGHLEVLEYLEVKRKDVRPDEVGNLPIHLAAKGGHLPIVDHLSNESNITSMTKDKRLPIHSAASHGHMEIVRRLLQLGRRMGVGIDVKCRDLSATVEESPDGLLTPLYLAVALGHPETAEYLIKEGADTKVRSFLKYTLLHEAARVNTSNIFHLLLEHNLNPFGKNENGRTPLHLAAALGSSNIVDIYLAMRNIDAGLNIVDVDGSSALALAIENKQVQIVHQLISKGAAIHLLDAFQNSTLIFSSDLEELTVSKRLLEEGVNVEIANASGYTALHNSAERGNLEVCEMLIDRGANVNVETPVTRLTPLHHAGQRNNVDIMLRLLDAGADPFKRDISGATIMDFVTTYQPTLDLLYRYRRDYEPLPSEERTHVLKSYFRAKLRVFPLMAPTDTPGRTILLVLLRDGLGYASWHLKEFDVFQICFEYSINRSNGSISSSLYFCDACWKPHVEGSFWRCKQCRSTEICNECYQKRSKGEQPRGCSAEHEYLELAGEEWRKLEDGKVNAKGQTFWEWIAELKETYLTGDDVEP